MVFWSSLFITVSSVVKGKALLFIVFYGPGALHSIPNPVQQRGKVSTIIYIQRPGNEGMERTCDLPEIVSAKQKPKLSFIPGSMFFPGRLGDPSNMTFYSF